MPLSEFSQAQTSNLKGLPGSFELCDQTQFRSLKKQIESLEFSKLNFFRSDMDIRRLLIYLNSNDLDFFQKMKILDHLKSFRVCRIDESIVGEYLRCFQKFDENLPENKTLLSSLLIVADNLIPKEFWNEQISEVILNAKCKADSRSATGIRLGPPFATVDLRWAMIAVRSRYWHTPPCKQPNCWASPNQNYPACCAVNFAVSPNRKCWNA